MLKLSEFLGVEEGLKFKMSSEKDSIFKIQDNVLLIMPIHQTLNQWQEWNLGINQLVHSKITILNLPILTDKEKEYLSSVVKPFRDRVEYIEKLDYLLSNEQFIKIKINDDNFPLAFPLFEENKYYKGMEVDKEYTLEELGL